MAIYTDEMGNVSGSEDGYIGSDETNRKTEKASATPEEKFKAESKQAVEHSGENNVLNGYRSVTYNFTLAVVRKSDLENPEGYTGGPLDLEIFLDLIRRSPPYSHSRYLARPAVW